MLVTTSLSLLPSPTSSCRRANQAKLLHKKNIKIVQNCPDITIFNPPFGHGHSLGRGLDQRLVVWLLMGSFMESIMGLVMREVLGYVIESIMVSIMGTVLGLVFLWSRISQNFHLEKIIFLSFNE